MFLTAARSTTCVVPDAGALNFACDDVASLSDFSSKSLNFAEEEIVLRIFGRCSKTLDLSNLTHKLRVLGDSHSQISITGLTRGFVEFENVDVLSDGVLAADSVTMRGVRLTGVDVLKARTLECDSASLENTKKVAVEFLDLDINNITDNMSVLIEVEKVAGDEVQVVVRNSVDVYLAFGANSLSFEQGGIPRIKVFGLGYPATEIFHSDATMYLTCYTGLESAYLLSPTIFIDGGSCIVLSDKWPAAPRQIDWFWQFERFVERNERTIWLVPASSASLTITGMNVPVSIRSDDSMVINVGASECGITGALVVRSPTDKIVWNGKKNAVFHVGLLIVDEGNLSANNEHLTLRFGVCNFSDIVSGRARLECMSVDNTKGNVQQRVNVIGEGTIRTNMMLNIDQISREIMDLLKDVKIPDSVYDETGNLVFTKLFSWAATWMQKNKYLTWLTLRTLRRLGNAVNKVNISSAGNPHKIFIERNDIPFMPFYSHTFTPTMPLVCDSYHHDFSQWQVSFSDGPFAGRGYRNIPLPEFSEADFKASVIPSRTDQEACLSLMLSYPPSAFEVFVYSDNASWHSSLDYLSYIGFHYVSRRDLGRLHTVLDSPQCKNIIFVALTTLAGDIDLTQFRDDVNFVFVGLSIDALNKMFQGTFDMEKDSRLLSPVRIICESMNTFVSCFSRINNIDLVFAKKVVLLCNSITNTKLQSEDLVVDMRAMEAASSISCDRLMLVPIAFHESLLISDLTSLTFNDDHWHCSFGQTLMDIPYSRVRTVFHVLSEIYNLNLNRSSTADFPETKLGFCLETEEKNLSEIIGVPVLEDSGTDDTFLTQIVGFASKLRKSLHAKLASVETTGDITVDGTWDNAGKVIIQSDNDRTVVYGAPHAITVIPMETLEYADVTSEKLQIRDVQKVRGSRHIHIPTSAEIAFDNISFTSKHSSFSVNDGQKPLNVTHMHISRDSYVNLTTVYLRGSLQLSDGASLFIDELDAPNATIKYAVDLSKPLPLVVIGRANAVSPLVLELSDPSSSRSNLYGLARTFLEVHTPTNLCDEINWHFVDPSHILDNEPATIDCHCVFDGTSTRLLLNMSMPVTEGPYDTYHDTSKTNWLPVVGAVMGVLLIGGIIVIVLIVVVRRRNRARRNSGTSTELLP